MSTDKITAFEDCLSRAQNGESIEQVLARYPRWANELRPLLTAAQSARSLAHPTVPSPAQMRSRAVFLGAAVQAAEQPRPGRLGLFLKRRALGLALAAMLALVLFATGVGTAQATPGNPLYPVKLAGQRAQLALTSNPERRLELEEDFERERVSEARQVLERGKATRLEFAGLLTQDAGGWRAGDVPLLLTPALEESARPWLGAYVEVRGAAGAGGVVDVERLELKLFEFKGTVQSINGSAWQVSNVNFTQAAGTRIEGTPRAGSRVKIEALRRASGLEMVTVKVEDSGGDDAPAGVTPEPGDDSGGERIGTDDHSGSTGSDGSELRATSSGDDDHNAATPQPTSSKDGGDDHSGSGSSATQTPKPDEHSGSSGSGSGGSSVEPTKTPKPDDH